MIQAIAALALIKDWFDLDSLRLSDYWKETNSWPYLGRTIIPNFARLSPGYGCLFSGNELGSLLCILFTDAPGGRLRKYEIARQRDTGHY